MQFSDPQFKSAPCQILCDFNESHGGGYVNTRNGACVENKPSRLGGQLFCRRLNLLLHMVGAEKQQAVFHETDGETRYRCGTLNSMQFIKPRPTFCPPHHCQTRPHPLIEQISQGGSNSDYYAGEHTEYQRPYQSNNCENELISTHVPKFGEAVKVHQANRRCGQDCSERWRWKKAQQRVEVEQDSDKHRGRGKASQLGLSPYREIDRGAGVRGGDRKATKQPRCHIGGS